MKQYIPLLTLFFVISISLQEVVATGSEIKIDQLSETAEKLHLKKRFSKLYQIIIKKEKGFNPLIKDEQAPLIIWIIIASGSLILSPFMAFFAYLIVLGSGSAIAGTAAALAVMLLPIALAVRCVRYFRERQNRQGKAKQADTFIR